MSPPSHLGTRQHRRTNADCQLPDRSKRATELSKRMAVLERRRDSRAAYLGAWLFMIIGVPISFSFKAHQIFALEAWEILAFLIYWGLQTRENWNEEIDENCVPAPKTGWKGSPLVEVRVATTAPAP